MTGVVRPDSIPIKASCVKPEESGSTPSSRSHASPRATSRIRPKVRTSEKLKRARPSKWSTTCVPGNSAPAVLGDDQAARHPQARNQRTSRGQIQDDVLAAPPDAGNPLAGNCRREADVPPARWRSSRAGPRRARSFCRRSCRQDRVRSFPTSGSSGTLICGDGTACKSSLTPCAIPSLRRFTGF